MRSRDSARVLRQAFRTSVTGVRGSYKALGLSVFCLLALGLGVPRASAHRAPASVKSLVAWGANGGARILRLSEGLATLGADGWRYVCPALWGADDVTPALALEDGTVVIGSYTGLFLLDASGMVTRHPDPAGQGSVFALAKAGTTVFALLGTADLTAVVRVSSSRAEMVWSDAMPWALKSLAADATNLHVLRADADQLEHLQLSLQGEVIAREQVTTPDMFVDVSAQITPSGFYVMGLTFGNYLLGQIVQGAWVTHCMSGLNLTGPVEVGGQQFVTVDNVLTEFTTDCAPAVSTPEAVSCVGQEGGAAYSCTKSGANLLNPNGVGDSLFKLSDLEPPDLSKAPSCDVRAMCTAQWERYQTDLVSTGMIDSAVGIGATGAGSGNGSACGDAGGAGGASGGGVAGLGGTGGAGVVAIAGAGAGGAVVPLPAGQPSPKSGGCRVADSEPVAGAAWLLLAFVPIWIGRRRSRRLGESTGRAR
jgi:hypothetical protein